MMSCNSHDRTIPFFVVTQALLVVVAFIGPTAHAGDHELSETEITQGWTALFNGHDLTGWKNNNDRPVAAKIEDGAINPHGSGGYLLVYEKPFGDFVLKCDVKMNGPECNSGIFVRCGNLADPVNTSLEVQVLGRKSATTEDFGAIYDLVAPSKNSTLAIGQWNTVEIRCEGPRIEVSVNGEKVTTMNADEWTVPGQRLDGTPHKFDKAIKDFPRSGYIGLQDHGHDVWYKNIKLRVL